MLVSQTIAPATRRGRFALLLGGAAAWGLLLYAALESDLYSGLIDHDSLCGPWGCAPAPEDLLRWHTLVMIVTVPALVLVSRWLQPNSRERFGLSLVGAGVLGATIIAGSAVVHWRQQAPDASSLKAAGFAVATATDWPCVPVAIAGLACVALARAPRRTRPDRPRRSDAVAEGSPETR